MDNDEVSKLLATLSPEELKALDEMLMEDKEKVLWRPMININNPEEPSPQAAAYYSEADVLLYGGASGGGKTDLMVGLALTAHHRSIIFRRQNKEVDNIVERIIELRGTRNGFNGQDNRFRLNDGGSLIKLGGMQHPGDEQAHQGHPYDLMCFDELTQFQEQQFRFLHTWNRSTKEGQRSRIVCASNPPTDASGEWVIRYWAPWLDPAHPNPAEPGELRWFISGEEGDEEVDGPEEVVRGKEVLKPKSRTFIPSKIDDNPFLLATDYKANLQSLPEPLRSQFLHGDFLAGREKDAKQVLPTDWVEQAMERWKVTPKPNVPQTAIGIDVARGGKDELVIAPRYENYFDRLISKPGVEIPDGPTAVAVILQYWRDASAINMDVIGIGSSPLDIFKGNEIQINPMVGNAASTERDKTGNFGFANERSKWWWRLREALDPDSGEDICLPPDHKLKADLCAPRFEIYSKGIKVEGKDSIKNRLGKTIGLHRGDAVVYALAKDSNKRSRNNRHLHHATSKYNPLKW